jgi:hypothetical protein
VIVAEDETGVTVEPADDTRLRADGRPAPAESSYAKMSA